MRRPGIAARLASAAAVAVVLTASALAFAQEAADEPARTAATEGSAAKSTAARAARKADAKGRVDVLALVKQANPMLWPLGLCSVVALGYALERLIALRRERVIPREFVTRFLERLSTGKLDRDRATELCRANESLAARAFGRIVHYWGHSAGAIRQAVGPELAGEVLELKRNTRVLNGTATLAPLLGLLGTVVGLIESFDALGGRTTAGAAKGEALAHGISLALMTTAFGLLIAVISVTFYYVLLNRIDALVRDLDRHATQVIDLVAAESAGGRRAIGSPNEITRQAMRD